MSEDNFGWFSEALKLEQAGNIAGALDILFQTLDNELRAGNFAEVNAFVESLNPDALSIDMMLGVLSLTRPAPIDKIPSRKQFFDDSWRTIESRKRDAKKLIGGLRNQSRSGQVMEIIHAR